MSLPSPFDPNFSRIYKNSVITPTRYLYQIYLGSIFLFNLVNENVSLKLPNKVLIADYDANQEVFWDVNQYNDSNSKYFFN